MRKYLIIVSLLLAACSPAEPEVVTTSVDVDHAQLEALFKDLNALTDKGLPAEAMIELALATPMDEELQERYTVQFDDDDREIQFHVWREQADWVHLYFSASSQALISAIENTSAAHARPSGD